MDLDLLPTFVVFAETRSFTDAGRRLGLSQPAVHQQVRRLSEQLGVVLYQRDGRRLVLTVAGERVATAGRDALGVRDRLLATLQGTPVGRPVVAAGRGAWLYLMVDALDPLDVQPLVRDGEGTLAAVREGRATLGVAVVEPPADLHQAPFRQVDQHLVVPVDHPLARSTTPVALADLGSERWVLPPPGRPLRERVQALVTARGGTLQLGVEAEGWDLLARFVASGTGITVLNASVPLPEGAAAVPLDLPPVVYRCLWRPEAAEQARPLLERLAV
jgi:DNA-binding transcriptional LysR family regulator